MEDLLTACSIRLLSLLSIFVNDGMKFSLSGLRVQHIFDYEAVPKECTKAVRALASLAYNDVTEVVSTSRITKNKGTNKKEL